MAAYMLIECDGCFDTKTWTSSMSPSNARRWALKELGWKTKRSAKITVNYTHGGVGTYTVALDFCPKCVEAGMMKEVTTPHGR